MTCINPDNIKLIDELHRKKSAVEAKLNKGNFELCDLDFTVFESVEEIVKIQDEFTDDRYHYNQIRDILEWFHSLTFSVHCGQTKVIAGDYNTLRDNPLVSIIIPVYNREKFINQCVESVTNQTYKNIEIIVVDDGSTDKTYSVCNEIAKKDSRVKVFQIDNSGVASARNRGIDISAGNYITFIDSDDYIADNYIELLLTALLNDNTDMSMITNPQIMIDGNYNRGSLIKRYKVNYSGKQLVSKLLQDHIEIESYATITVWGKLFRSEMFAYLRFIEGSAFEDTYILPIIYSKLKTVSFVDDALYFYVIHAESEMSKLGKRGPKFSYDLIRAHINKIEYFYNRGFTSCDYTFERRLLVDLLLMQKLDLSQLEGDEFDFWYDMFAQNQRWYDAQEWVVFNSFTQLIYHDPSVNSNNEYIYDYEVNDTDRARNEYFSNIYNIYEDLRLTGNVTYNPNGDNPRHYGRIKYQLPPQ